MNKDLNLFIINEIKKISGKENLCNETKVEDLNFEFIDFIELSLEIEEKYEVLVDENKIEKKNNIEEIFIYIKTIIDNNNKIID